MSGGRALNAIRRGRRTFVTLLLVCLVLVAGATFLGTRSLEQAESQAQITAKGLANAGVASVLVPGQVTGTIGGATARDLLSRLQRGVLADGTAFRVRVWSPSGDLLFSTDAGDESDAVSGNLDAIYAATRNSGRISSIASSDGQVFATFVPLRLGQTGSIGAVEVDQGYERIATSASSPWRLLRTIGIVGAALSLLLVIVASLPGSGSRSGGFLTPGREAALARQRAKDDQTVIRAQERATFAEERLKDAEHRARDSEARERDAQTRTMRAETELENARSEVERAQRAAADAADSAARSQPDEDMVARVGTLERELAARTQALA
ncbi:MAG: hypothetical protein OEW46_04650, partial [Actinomycetota bacterium]|nr:hypothetical protein [Actinomycetota bacterium]